MYILHVSTVSIGEATRCRSTLDGRRVSYCVAGPQTCQRGATVQVTRRRRRSRGEPPLTLKSTLLSLSARACECGAGLGTTSTGTGGSRCLGHGVGPSGSSRTCLIASPAQRSGKQWRGKGETSTGGIRYRRRLGVGPNRLFRASHVCIERESQLHPDASPMSEAPAGSAMAGSVT